MTTEALSALPAPVREDLLRGIVCPVPAVFVAGTKLYRFSSSSLFAEGFFVSPWWFKHQDFRVVFEVIRRDPEYLSARARSQATIPLVWNGSDTANLLDLVVEVTLKSSALFFRGPGTDQRRGTKILRAPRGAMQNFMPKLSWRNQPRPNLTVARALFMELQTTPIGDFRI